MNSSAPGLAAGFSLKTADILAANYGGNSVLKIDAATGEVQDLGMFVTPTDVALTQNGDLYISEWGGYLYRLTLTNGVLELLNPDTLMYSVWGLLIDPTTGDLIVTCGANDSIVRVNPATGAETVISETNELYGVSGMAWLDPHHVVVCSTFNNQLVKVALANGAQTVIPTAGGGIDMPRGIAVFGNDIFMTAFDSREIRRIPSVGGTVTTFYTATGVPFGMAVETNGNVVTGTSGAAYEVLRVSLDGTLLHTYSDALISEVTGVVISPIDLEATGLVNTPPALEPLADQPVDEGVLLTFDALATDTNWPPQALSFSLDPGAPNGAEISSSGVFSWIPTEAQGPSNFVITVRVTDDGVPPLSSTQTLSVAVQEVNARPVLNLTNRLVAEGDLVSFTVAVTDADLPPQVLILSLLPGAPAGASLTTNGLFSWTPGETNGGNAYVLKVQVTDNGTPPLSATNNLTITVTESNVAPVLAPIAGQAVDEGDVLTFAAAATDSDLPVQKLTFSLEPGAPAGASISTNGVFTWTPTDAQGPSNYVITVKVTDSGTPPRGATNTVAVAVNELYLQSSPDVTGPYQDDPAALFDKVRRTIAVDQTPAGRGFYRLRCTPPLRLLQPRLSSSQVLLEYQSP